MVSLGWCGEEWSRDTETSRGWSVAEVATVLYCTVLYTVQPRLLERGRPPTVFSWLGRYSNIPQLNFNRGGYSQEDHDHTVSAARMTEWMTRMGWHVLLVYTFYSVMYRHRGEIDTTLLLLSRLSAPCPRPGHWTHDTPVPCSHILPPPGRGVDFMIQQGSGLHTTTTISAYCGRSSE